MEGSNRGAPSETDGRARAKMQQFGAMLPSPEPGDVILTNTLNARFVLVDPTGQRIAGPFPTVLTAIESARTHTTGNIWQQSSDNRGRLVGNPIRLDLPPR